MENIINNEIVRKSALKWDDMNHMSYFNDLSFVENIRQNYKIVAEPIGTPKTSRRQNKILTKPFVLDKFETFYLYEK